MKNINRKIQELYPFLTDKTGFVKSLAIYFDINPLSIRNHWFSSEREVPKKRQQVTLAMMKEALLIEKEEREKVFELYKVQKCTISSLNESIKPKTL